MYFKGRAANGSLPLTITIVSSRRLKTTGRVSN